MEVTATKDQWLASDWDEVGLPHRCRHAITKIVEYSEACCDGGLCTKDQWLASDWDEVGLPQRCPNAIAQIVLGQDSATKPRVASKQKKDTFF
jgi:hypothetical protein